MNQRIIRRRRLLGTFVTPLVALALVIGFLPDSAGAVTTVTSGTVVTETYSYTGATETLTVPAGVSSITLTMLGAEGGRGGRDASGTAPAGGYQGQVTGTLAVTPGQVLTIAVGQGGFNSTVWNSCTTGANYATGDPMDAVGGLNPLGYNGGAGGSPGATGCSGYGGSGGAASVVELGTSSAPASSAQIVAGGSGGSGGSGQFSPTLGQISLPSFQARPDLTGTSGQQLRARRGLAVRTEDCV
jgi:titin